ncbi:MAG TPA: hypothetical protein ENF61_01660, partial [Firmicutes bacterium]|nr:hypothetical protein [Bacillota bacterium]
MKLGTYELMRKKYAWFFIFVLRKIILFIVISFGHFAIAKDLEITVIYDNNPYNKELETGWGFSCLVEG